MLINESVLRGPCFPASQHPVLGELKDIKIILVFPKVTEQRRSPLAVIGLPDKLHTYKHYIAAIIKPLRDIGTYLQCMHMYIA